jgi:DNA transformation protein
VSPAEIEDLFASCGPVSIRRMFGGHGIYADGRMVALEASGVLYLKADALSSPRFAEAGSEPFTYAGKGRPVQMSYWRVPEDAFEDADLMREFFALAVEAARRAGTAAASRQGRRKSPRPTGPMGEM